MLHTHHKEWIENNKTRLISQIYGSGEPLSVSELIVLLFTACVTLLLRFTPTTLISAAQHAKHNSSRTEDGRHTHTSSSGDVQALLQHTVSPVAVPAVQIHQVQINLNTSDILGRTRAGTHFARRGIFISNLPSLCSRGDSSRLRGGEGSGRCPELAAFLIPKRLNSDIYGY